MSELIDAIDHADEARLEKFKRLCHIGLRHPASHDHYENLFRELSKDQQITILIKQLLHAYKEIDCLYGKIEELSNQ